MRNPFSRKKRRNGDEENKQVKPEASSSSVVNHQKVTSSQQSSQVQKQQSYQNASQSYASPINQTPTSTGHRVAASSVNQSKQEKFDYEAHIAEIEKEYQAGLAKIEKEEQKVQGMLSEQKSELAKSQKLVSDNKQMLATYRDRIELIHERLAGNPEPAMRDKLLAGLKMAENNTMELREKDIPNCESRLPKHAEIIENLEKSLDEKLPFQRQKLLEIRESSMRAAQHRRNIAASQQRQAEIAERAVSGMMEALGFQYNAPEHAEFQQALHDLHNRRASEYNDRQTQLRVDVIANFQQYSREYYMQHPEKLVDEFMQQHAQNQQNMTYCSNELNSANYNSLSTPIMG